MRQHGVRLRLCDRAGGGAGLSALLHAAPEAPGGELDEFGALRFLLARPVRVFLIVQAEGARVRHFCRLAWSFFVFELLPSLGMAQRETNETFGLEFRKTSVRIAVLAD